MPKLVFSSWYLVVGRKIHTNRFSQYTLYFLLTTLTQVSKNCVQPVSADMNKQWVQLPQVIQNLWTNKSNPMTVSPPGRFFLPIAHAFPTTLFAPKIRDITDKTPHLSTLSTLPITTTTIYI